MKDWTTTYIIGAGPSAGPVDVSRLTGGVVLGVNDAFFYKTCDVFFSLDHNYVRKVIPKLADYQCEKHVCLMDREYFKQTYKDAGLTRWHRVFQDTPSTLPKHLASGGSQAGCSGLVAINLAVQMGARHIYLFGYDFHHSYSYFYNPELIKRPFATEVLKAFRRMGGWYQQRGIEIINCNLDSYIDAFELISLDMAYLTIERGAVRCGA